MYAEKNLVVVMKSKKLQITVITQENIVALDIISVT